MSAFAMSMEDLKSTTLDAIRDRAAALESPLADEDAAALAKLVNGGDVEGPVTEMRYNEMMAQIASLDKAQLQQMMMMAKMMGGMMDGAALGGGEGDGLESMAQSMAAAMGANMAAAAEGSAAGSGSTADSEPSDEDKAPFHGPDGAWRMSIPRSVKIDELLRLLNVFKGYKNTRWPAKPERVYVDKVVMAIRGCSSVIKSRQDAAVAAGVVEPLIEVLTGVHLEDRETCLRTVQCLLGICGKNESATEAFKAAGAGDALVAIHAKHKDSNSKDFEKAVALFTA